MKLLRPFIFLSFLGRPGSGKGTQAKLLAEKYPLKHISSGRLLRARAKKRDFLGRKIHTILEKGALIPTPVIFQLWMPELQALLKESKYRGVILDGSPRKLYEAKMLEEVLELFGWDKELHVLDIWVSEKEAIKRLLKRGRSDDEIEDIKSRLKWFHYEVDPVLRHFKKKGILLQINGEQSREAVHKEIMRKLKKFLK